MDILHKISHILRMNKGNPDAFYEGGKLMMSFKCGGCGERSGIHPIDEILDEIIRNSTPHLLPADNG